MTKIVFVEYNGSEHAIDAEDGSSLMEVATQNDVPGIDADCGGQCACATCHIYLPADRLGERSEMEADMLDLAENVNDCSRLACQVEVTESLNGIRVSLPESQH